MAVKERHPNPIIRWIEIRRRQLTVDACAPQSHEQWLDLGCDTGFLADGLAPKVKTLTCADIDPNLIEIAKNRLQRHGNIRFLAAEASDLIRENTGKFDGILAAEILEHLPDPAGFLRELRSLLKRDGRIVVTVPNDRLILTLKRRLIQMGARSLFKGLAESLAVGHLRIFSKESLNSMMSKEFVAVRISHPFPWLNYFATGIPRSEL